MAGRRHRGGWGVAAGLAALGLGAGLLERRHMRGIADDPEHEALREPASGRPLSVRSADGTALHVEEFGPDPGSAAGATVVLAHGWTEALIFWTYVIQALTEAGIPVVAYDLRGHGSSDPAVDDDYSVRRFGEDVEAVLNACVPDGRRAVIAGHSLGAMSIVAWAERFDVWARTGAALLANTGVGDLVADELLVPVPAVAQVVSRALPPGRVMTSRAPLPRFSTPVSSAAIRYIAFGPRATPAQVAFYQRMLVTVPPDARARVAITLSGLDLHRALPRLTLPTIVVAGEQDRLTPPSHARQIAEALPNLEHLTVLPGCGHMSPLECHVEVTDALTELSTRLLAESALAARA